MITQLYNDTLKAVGVRYAVNPELGHRGVVETEEMCQKTIAKLKWLDEKHPRVVLMADSQNKDTHAVLVYTKKNGWSMHDKGGVTDGVKYDTTSKVLEKQLKKFDTSAPYGVLEVDWKL